MIDRWPFYGYCIFENEVCNGHKDCEDGSDEANCDVSLIHIGAHVRDLC